VQVIAALKRCATQILAALWCGWGFGQLQKKQVPPFEPGSANLF
jgi:hypothetical protein